MIIKEYGAYVVYCDGCGACLGSFRSFEAARDAISKAEWSTHKYKETWANCCPECSQYMQEAI